MLSCCIILKTRNKYGLHGVNTCKQHICYDMCCHRAVEYKLYQAWYHHTCEQHICYNMYFHRPVTVSCPKSPLQICSARTWNRSCTDPLQSVQNLLCKGQRLWLLIRIPRVIEHLRAVLVGLYCLLKVIETSIRPRWGTCYCRKPRKSSVFMFSCKRDFRLTISLLTIFECLLNRSNGTIIVCLPELSSMGKRERAIVFE